MKQAKRTYAKPAMRTVALQHRTALLEASLVQTKSSMNVTYEEEDI